MIAVRSRLKSWTVEEDGCEEVAGELVEAAGDAAEVLDLVEVALGEGASAVRTTTLKAY